MAIRGIN